MLYQSMIPILLINLLVSSGLVYGLWDVVSHTTLSIWMGFMLAMLLVRGVLYFNYLHQFKPEYVKRYSLFLVIGSGAAGLIWGTAGVVMFPADNLNYQLFVVFVLLGMSAGSISSLYIYLPALFAFLPISMLPISFMLLSINDSIHLSLGLLSIFYVVSISFFNIKINKGLKTSLRLRFENIDLVEQLREQKIEADNANMAKSKFLAAASHDLRQPLYALSLFTSVLDETIKYPKVRRVVDQIQASVSSLQSLFNALLDISRLDAGVMKTEKTDFNLQTFFTALSNDFDSMAAEKGLVIIWPESNINVHSDQDLLKQILNNYISNAIRYTDTGNIRIQCEEKNKQVTISVIDSGIGIPLTQQDIIFEEFHQLSNPERDRSKGLGLGLAIVQRTAKLLGHSIDITSTPNQGSAFSVTVALSTVSEIAAPNTHQIKTDTTLNSSSLILVIDDEENIREATQMLFSLWGCDVIAVSSKKEALAELRLQDKIPDGIIADYRLRENQNGINAVKEIQAEYHSDIPSLIVTGDIAIEDLKKVNNSGLQVLHKPVAEIKLRTFLRHVQQHQNASKPSLTD